jgi:hypothetical protein
MKPLRYIYFWNRQGRKGQPCEVLVRAKVMNSCLVRFEDGYTMVTSRNAIRKNPEFRRPQLNMSHLALQSLELRS